MISDDGFTVLDLFSGAGGLAEGFIRAGFRTVGHVEMEKYAFMTLKTRIAYHLLKYEGDRDTYHEYLYGDTTREEMFHRVVYHMADIPLVNAKIETKTQKKIADIIMAKSKFNTVNVITGGPPCQTFSHISRYRRKRDVFFEDERTYLFKRYLYFIRKFKPDFFVFENVTGIITAGGGAIFSEFIDKARKAGYNVKAQVLNARDFNVLQNRRRVIVIGWKRKHRINDIPIDLHHSTESRFRVWDVLSDLPKLQPRNGSDAPQKYSAPPSEYLLKFGLRSQDDVLTLHRARYHNERDRKIYRMVISVWNEEHKRLKYNELPDHLKTHRNRHNFVDRFKVVAGDLPYSQTITAHLAKDGHYYIHPDISQARSITVREAARLQSFPDSYFFEGPRTAQFVQVGNAVPPLMAETIAIKIKSLLEEI